MEKIMEPETKKEEKTPVFVETPAGKPEVCSHCGGEGGKHNLVDGDKCPYEEEIISPEIPAPAAPVVSVESPAIIEKAKLATIEEIKPALVEEAKPAMPEIPKSEMPKKEIGAFEELFGG